jgi:hypothetical protein
MKTLVERQKDFITGSGLHQNIWVLEQRNISANGVQVIVADITVYVNCASRDGIRYVLRFLCALTKLILMVIWLKKLESRCSAKMFERTRCENSDVPDWVDLFPPPQPTLSPLLRSQPPHPLDKENEHNNLD